MNIGGEGIYDIYPLSYFTKRLAETSNNIPLTHQDVPVVSGFFDSYRSNVVAPDHLLSGLAKNILNVCIRCLPNDSSRAKFDNLVCSYLSLNGLPKERSIYNLKRKQLHTMSMSSVLSILLLASYIFPIFQKIDSVDTNNWSPTYFEKSISLLIELRELFSLTYWWPNYMVDGVELISKYTRHKNSFYYGTLIKKCKDYIFNVNKFYILNNKLGNELDKPNLHRLLELYVTTIPTYGHARNISEMVFETFHQRLKRNLKKSTHLNKHIVSVENVLINDWLSRFSFCLSEINKHQVIDYDSPLIITMKRLLLGERSMCIDGKNASEKQFLEHFVKQIHNLTENNILSKLSELGVISNLNGFMKSKKSWEGLGTANLDSAPYKSEHQSGYSVLKKILSRFK